MRAIRPSFDGNEELYPSHGDVLGKAKCGGSGPPHVRAAISKQWQQAARRARSECRSPSLPPLVKMDTLNCVKRSESTTEPPSRYERNVNGATASLSVEDKRQVLYAALLRHSAEVASLRNRALDRVVMAGLLGSSAADPFRIGAIVKNIAATTRGVELRSEVVQDAVERLIESDVVAKTELLKRHAYFLRPEKAPELASAIDEGQRLFASVLDRMLDGTSHLVERKIADSLCRAFISECFARYGRQLALASSGHVSSEDAIRTSEAHEAFKAASQSQRISKEAAESLETRCISFLRSMEPDDERLKFFMTQGFYLSHLLGMQGSRFDPLAENAFANAVFYLDTNVLIPHFLKNEESPSFLRELASVAHRIGITLRVTKATLDEARQAAADHVTRLGKVVANLPAEMVRRAKDDFAQAYAHARESNPAFATIDLLEPFESMRDVLQSEMGVDIDERDAYELLAGRTFASESRIIQDSCVGLRGFGKSRAPLRHDVAHYALISDERARNPKFWFLTQDRSLMNAAAALSKDSPAFCFSISALLQGMSPYLSANEESSVAEFFSALLSDPILPAGTSVFDLQELTLIAELHEDVLATPTDQLVRAFDHVKQEVLKGASYDTKSHAKAALAIKKYLASSTEVKHKVLLADAERLRLELGAERKGMQTERESRLAAEKRAQEEAENNEALKAALASAHEREQQRRVELEQEMARLLRRKERARQAAAFGVFLFGLVLFVFAERVVSLAGLPEFSDERRYLLQLLVGLLATLLVTVPTCWVIVRQKWSEPMRMLGVTGALAVGVALSKLLGDKMLADVSAYLQIGSTVAAVVVAWLSRSPSSQ